MIKKIVKGLWVFFALMVLAGIAVFASIAYGWIGYMPPVEELENPNYKFATEILSEDGKVLGTWSLSKENRVYTSYNELSPCQCVDRHGGRSLYRTFGYRCQSADTCCGKAWIADAEKCRWRQYAFTTARQAIIYGRSCQKYAAAPVSEADRVGDCRKTGTLLYKGRNFEYVSQ